MLLDKPYAGIPAGTELLISSPQAVDAWVRTIPKGTLSSVTEMRHALAAAAACRACCPTSSAIFLRIVAEAAWDEILEGASLSQVAPFWRLIDPDSAMARRLRTPPEWIRLQREAERGGA